MLLFFAVYGTDLNEYNHTVVKSGKSKLNPWKMNSWIFSMLDINMHWVLLISYLCILVSFPYVPPTLSDGCPPLNINVNLSWLPNCDAIT